MSSEDVFEALVGYLNEELSASIKDYEFVTKLNKTTTATFEDYMQVAEKIAKNVDRINENQKAKVRLDTLVQAIDEIDSKVSKLESMVYKIDSYSKRLEETFKKLEPNHEGDR